MGVMEGKTPSQVKAKVQEVSLTYITNHPLVRGRG